MSVDGCWGIGESRRLDRRDIDPEKRDSHQSCMPKRNSTCGREGDPPEAFSGDVVELPKSGKHMSVR